MQIQTIHWRSEGQKAGYSIVHRRQVIHSSNLFLVGGQLAVPPRPGLPLVFVGGGIAGSVTTIERHRVECPWPYWVGEIRRMSRYYRVRDRQVGDDGQWIADWLGGLTPLEAWAGRYFKAA